jgi:hypothetical protein
VGFSDYIDNHEFVSLYSGKSMAELMNESTVADIAAVAEGKQDFVAFNSASQAF